MSNEVAATCLAGGLYLVIYPIVSIISGFFLAIGMTFGFGLMGVI